MINVRKFCVGCGKPECPGTCPERRVLDQKVEDDIRQWETDQKTKFDVRQDVLDSIKTELDKIVEKR